MLYFRTNWWNKDQDKHIKSIPEIDQICTKTQNTDNGNIANISNTSEIIQVSIQMSMMAWYFHRILGKGFSEMQCIRQRERITIHSIRETRTPGHNCCWFYIMRIQAITNKRQDSIIWKEVINESLGTTEGP